MKILLFPLFIALAGVFSITSARAGGFSVGLTGAVKKKSQELSQEVRSAQSAAVSSVAAVTVARERLFIGTGEYNTQDWHAIVRLENAQDVNSSTAVPSGTMNVQSSSGTSSQKLVFGHGIFVDESRDELYLSTLFTSTMTDPTPCADPNSTAMCGAISVFSNASNINGPALATRHIFGSSTTLDQPHGVWVDTSRDILYAANTFGGTILAWSTASVVTGDAAPSRVISSPGSSMGSPVFVFVDSAEDRLFAAVMSASTGPGTSVSAVLIYNNASTLSISTMPAVRLFGSTSRLNIGNPTTHNVWYDRASKLMYVGHHTNEVLIFDMSGVNLTPSIYPNDVTNLAPRVLKINESSNDSDSGNWSTYGFFYVASEDRLFVAAGYASGGPQSGCPKNAVKVYDNASSSSVEGLYTPTRSIWWSNCDKYYPPQPLWITLH